MSTKPSAPKVIQAIEADLIAIIRAYAEASGLAVTTVSRKFHGNQAFLEQFKSGDISITLGKLREMLKAFGKAWPKDAAHPKLKMLNLKS